MDYSIVKSELEPIIIQNNQRLTEINNEIQKLQLEMKEKYDKIHELEKEKDILEQEKSRVTEYFDKLTGLYYASLIMQRTGEPLGGLYYRTQQLNTQKLSQLVTEYKIYEVLHIMNVITTNRILCRRVENEYIRNGQLIDDLLVLHNCIHTCSNLYHSFIKKYGSGNVFNLLKINLTEEQTENIQIIMAGMDYDQRKLIDRIISTQKSNDVQIDRLMARTNGHKLYQESEYFQISRKITKELTEEQKKLKVIQRIRKTLGSDFPKIRRPIINQIRLEGLEE